MFFLVTKIGRNLLPSCLVIVSLFLPVLFFTFELILRGFHKSFSPVSSFNSRTHCLLVNHRWKDLCRKYDKSLVSISSRLLILQKQYLLELISRIETYGLVEFPSRCIDLIKGAVLISRIMMRFDGIYSKHHIAYNTHQINLNRVRFGKKCLLYIVNHTLNFWPSRTRLVLENVAQDSSTNKCTLYICKFSLLSKIQIHVQWICKRINLATSTASEDCLVNQSNRDWGLLGGKRFDTAQSWLSFRKKVLIEIISW